MRKYILIGISGAIGVITRYIIMDMPINLTVTSLPYDTLIINISGSFFIALILSLAYKTIKLDTNIRLAIVWGFVGGFTTFSSLWQVVFLGVCMGVC